MYVLSFSLTANKHLLITPYCMYARPFSIPKQRAQTSDGGKRSYEKAPTLGTDSISHTAQVSAASITCLIW